MHAIHSGAHLHLLSDKNESFLIWIPLEVSGTGVPARRHRHRRRRHRLRCARLHSFLSDSKSYLGKQWTFFTSHSICLDGAKMWHMSISMRTNFGRFERFLLSFTLCTLTHTHIRPISYASTVLFSVLCNSQLYLMYCVCVRAHARVCLFH